MNTAQIIKFSLISFFLVVLASCGEGSPNAEFNDMLIGEWEVRSIETNDVDIFPSTYKAQSYTFKANDDIKEEGEVEIVTALAGVTTAPTTEEYEYVITGDGTRISWDFSAKDIAIVDTTLTIYIGTGADQWKVTAVAQ